MRKIKVKKRNIEKENGKNETKVKERKNEKRGVDHQYDFSLIAN